MIYLIVVPYCKTKSPFCDSWRQQGLYVVVRRELCEGIRLGSRVSVVGVPTHKLITESLKTHIAAIIEVCV